MNDKRNDNYLSEHAGKLTTCQLALVVIFACIGNGTVFITRGYTAGFYIDFLQENELDATFGKYIIYHIY
jgi:hypothetical protein